MEPPEDAANKRAAGIMAVITNMAGKSLKDGKQVSAEDFYGKKRERRQTVEQQIAFFKGIDHGS